MIVPFLFLFSISTVTCATSLPHQVGQFKVPEAGFVNILPLHGQGKPMDMIVSCFTGSPFESGHLRMVSDIESALHNISNINVQDVTDGLQWPNSINPAPANLFPGDATIIVADGFLVPGKDTGGIYAISFTNGVAATPLALSTPKTSYFYHFTQWIDMNNDGRLDLLTARATKPLFGNGSGELLWLEQPLNITNAAWIEHVLNAGPDVDFVAADLDQDPTTVEVVAAQFFTSVLSLTQIDLNNGNVLKTVTIDNTIGQAYSVELVSLTGDGIQQLLVTNHAPSATTSGMWAYEIPNNLWTGIWSRHTLASQFPVTEPGFNQDAPGFAYAIHPQINDTTSPPVIVVAGDGAQTAYLFTPNAGSKWNYTQQTIYFANGTVGSLAVADVDGDGYMDLFVPDYDHGVVTVFSWSPSFEDLFSMLSRD